QIVQNAAQESRINRTVADATGMQNAIIVPLLTLKGTVIGTLLVERNDGREHTREEMDDLEQFARNLGTAIAQSERVEMLQSALDQLGDPVVIVDRQMGVRYANGPASQYLDLKSRWHEPEDARLITEWVGQRPGDDVAAKFLP